jgi:hypothetical protein
VKSTAFLSGLAAVALLPAAALPCRAAGDIHVSVVAILATADTTKVDPQVEAIAREVRKKYPSLTGFRLGRMTSDQVAVGKEMTFPLGDDQKAVVAVQRGPDKNDRVRLKVKPPHLNDIVYTTSLDKYFPIVTPYLTRTNQERLIIAIMVSEGPARDK